MRIDGLILKPAIWKMSANLMLTSLLLAVTLLTAANNIQADTFKNECDKAFGSCPAVVSSITSVLNLDVSNVVVDGISGTGLDVFQTMSGEVNFLNTKWTFLLHSGRNNVDQFIAFKPTTKVVTLKDMIQTSNAVANTAIGLFDAMVPSQQAVVFTANGIDMNPFVHGAAVPAPVKTFFDPLYQADHSYKNGDFVIKQAPGLHKLDVVDLGNSDVLSMVLDGVGFSGSQLLIHSHLGENILGALLGGSKPNAIPDVNVTATLPKFTPKILGQLQIPIPDLKFKLEGGFKKAETYKVSLGVSVVMPIELGGENVSMNLASVLSQSVTGAEASVSATMANNAVWKPAFGIDWLGIQNYTMKFSIIAGATTGVKVGFGGYTMFGDKNVYLASSATSSSASLGIPIPSELTFAILPTDPNEVGSLSLVDMVTLYNKIAKEANAGTPQIDVDLIPDIALAGKEKNTGPSISIVLGNDPKFELKDANLRVMSEDIANVTIASLDPTGIKINGSTNDDLYAGPFHVPSLEVDISVKVDELPPKITFKTNTTILPGTESTLELALLAGVGRFSTVQDFGDAFKFNLAATAGSEDLFSFNKNSLKDADISLDASLSSDPGAWIRTEGKKYVNQAFAGLRNGVSDAQNNVRNAQGVVNNLSGDIFRMRATVLNERKPINARITSAQNHVNSLSGDINTKNSEISRAKAKLSSCTQTVRTCTKTKVVWDRPPWKCTKYENKPDLWKRSFCGAKNTPIYAEIGALETAKSGLVVAKASAQETLRLLKEGYNSIPVDLDPRVAALITAKETATLALNVAQAALTGFDEFTKLLTNATDILDHADIFVIKDSSLRGSLKDSLAGEPVVLDMNFSVKGSDFSQRLGFSLTDMSYNAEQFEVIALGIVTNVFLEAAKDLKIIPPELLEDVAALYRERLLTLEEEVAAVVTSNGTLPEPYSGPIIAVTPLTGGINAGFATAMQAVLTEREKELTAARIKANQLKKCLRARSQNPDSSSKSNWGAFKVQSQIDDMLAKMEKRLMMNPITAAQCDKLIAEEQANTSYITGGIDPLPPQLTALPFETQQSKAGSLSLLNGWATYGPEYGVPSYKLDAKGTVVVTGLITGGNYGELATLPAGVRPSKQLVFNMNNHGKSARVDVFPDGKIKWVAGGKEHGWISLSGINFDLDPGKALKLSSGWQKYPAVAYGIPTHTKSDTIVRLEGLIKHGAIKPSTIATLPPAFRPNKILVFNVNNQAKSTRIDILPNGQIKWVAGGKDHGWASLSGINFNLAQGKVLPLTNGWKKYHNAKYAAPSYSKSGDIVTLEGLAEHGAIKPGVIATLPAGFRPSTHLLFSANNHTKSARIDIFPNGQIKWTAGGNDHGWVSLSGISFSIK